MADAAGTQLPTESDPEILDGLWSVLVRLVPRARRREAWALANVLHHFLKLPDSETTRLARKAGFDAGQMEGFERGFAAGLVAGRLAERNHRAGLDADDESEPAERKH